VAIRIRAGFGTPNSESGSREKHEDYLAGRYIFDQPNWETNGNGTDHYQAASGIHKLVNGWDVPDRYCGFLNGERPSFVHLPLEGFLKIKKKAIKRSVSPFLMAFF
jgi:hypothetical protein